MKNVYVTLKPVSLICLFFCLGIGKSTAVEPNTIGIHSIGHASLYFEYKNLIIHVDPYSAQGNYDLMPDANLIFITHDHSDHYDLTALNKIKTDSTVMICPQAVKNLGTYKGTIDVMNNGDSMIIKGIPVKAVPAYNVVNTSYHPKGKGNGYILTFGQKRIYVAGDTENIPEMKNLGKIDIAFLPMNLPYTMTTSAAAEAAKIIHPDILYIYHFGIGTSDTASLRNMLKDQDMILRMGKSVFYESDQRAMNTSSIHSAATETPIRFYPNPVKDYLTICNLNPGSHFSLFNLTGQLLIEKRTQNEGENKMDMKSLMPGSYVLRFQDKQLVKSSLIVKE